MKLLKRLGLGILLLAAIFIAVSFVLPRNITVLRAIDINVSEEQLFSTLNNIRKFNDWSPWATIDPKTVYTYSTIEEGVGAKMSWKSDHPHVGTGSSEISKSTPNSHIGVILDFGPQGKASSAYDLKRGHAGTNVVWSFSTDLGNNPIQRWMGIMFDRWIGAEYEKGLKRLKRLAETGSAD